MAKVGLVNKFTQKTVELESVDAKDYLAIENSPWVPATQQDAVLVGPRRVNPVPFEVAQAGSGDIGGAPNVAKSGESGEASVEGSSGEPAHHSRRRTAS